MEMPNCRYLQISLDLIGLGPSTRLFSLLLDFNGQSLSQSASQLVSWYFGILLGWNRAFERLRALQLSAFMIVVALRIQMI